MGYYIGKFIFFLLGWKLVSTPPPGLRRCVMIAAPHTSNWDFIIARAAFAIMRIPVKFTIKKEWFRFPFNIFFNAMGGIAIDRSPKEAGKPRRSSTEAMVELFEKYKDLVVLITPEGTRKKKTEWKTGFYYVAKMAHVPIACGWLDYSKKHAGVGLILEPGESMEDDLRKIMQFYHSISPRFPEGFSIDTRFV